MTSRRPVVVVAILLAMFMAAMEATVIGTAMPTVARELQGLEFYGWVGAIYMLATTVTIPIYGKLADGLGRKPAMLIGIALFLTGSIASGMARSMVALIVARAVQGAGAGGIQPIALTIVGDLFTPAERARVQGLFGAVWGVAGISGPLLGGLIVHALSWRWVFYINVPFGCLSALLLAIAHRERMAAVPERGVDVFGALFLTTSVVSLLAAVSGRALVLTIPICVVSVLSFLVVEVRHASPLLPLDLLRRRLIAVSSAAGAIVGGVMTSSVLYVPLYVQSILGGTPTEGGTAVAPMLVGWPIASALSGRILLKTGPRPLVRGGFLLVALASIALDRAVSAHAGINTLRLIMFVFGTGMGLANTALIIAVQDSVGFAQRGVATGSTMFFRTIGGAVTVGALGAVLARVVSGGVPEPILDSILGPEHGRELGAGALAHYSVALHAGLLPIFHALATLGVVGWALGMLMPAVQISHVKTTVSAKTGPNNADPNNTDLNNADPSNTDPSSTGPSDTDPNNTTSAGRSQSQ